MPMGDGCKEPVLMDDLPPSTDLPDFIPTTSAKMLAVLSTRSSRVFDLSLLLRESTF